MLNHFYKFYRKKQLLKLYKQYNSIARIGDFFECSNTSSIINESGNKNNIIIGHHCRLNGSLYCKTDGKVEIGNYCTIQTHVKIQCLSSIKIGHFVGIGDGAVLVDNSNHLVEPEERIIHRIRVAPGGQGYEGLGDGWELSSSAPIIVEDVAWIGTNSVILKGITIGEGAIVARNAVVTKDVMPYTIVAGNPAKPVKQLEKPQNDYYNKYL